MRWRASPEPISLTGRTVAIGEGDGTDRARAELDDLDDRLRSHRIVTIVGPGGVGKTALADVAAARATPRFPMGMRRIDLTRVEDPDALPGTVAAQLGYESYEALIGSPGDQPALLVFDNCEHLLDAAAETIAAVLGACEQPTVLATSRSPLELPGEAVVPLAPLAVPAPSEPEPALFAAVQLFLDRAAASGADLARTDLDLVALLCRRLEGLPLAIELAAARSWTLSLGDVADRLLAGGAVLDRPRFRGEARHRSLDDTIRWSYDLLDPGPACLLQQLSVFAGPFAPAAATAVAAAEGCGGDVEHDLENLVHASLVAVDTSGSQTRYRLLATIRRFARSELTRCGGLQATMDAFVDVVLAGALETTKGGTLVWRPEMISELLDGFDNLAEALRWCNEHDTDPGRALTLCGVLWTVVHQGRAEDVALLARQTLARWPGTRHRRSGAAVATLATAEYVSGHPERALEIAEPALAEVGPGRSAPIKLLRLIGQARSAVGDVEAAIGAFAEGARLARDAGMSAMAIELDIVHAHARSVAHAGDTDALAGVIADIERAATEADTLGSAVTAAWARTTLGWVLLRTDAARARPVIEQALASCRSIRYPIGIAGNLRSLAYAHLLAGDVGSARSAAQELLDDLLDRGALSDVRLVVDVTATLAARAAHPDWPVLAATAASLPVVSLLLTPGSEPVPLPPSDAAPLERHQVVRELKRVLAELAAPAPAPAPAPVAEAPAPAERHRFAPVGDVWELEHDGVRATVRSTKGMADLARLLAEPEREVHCLDLAGAATEEASTGEVIDAPARRRYEERIRELQAEIDDAEDANDLARSERAQEEFDALVDHLTAAVGRSGRTRQGGGTVERARSTVTQRIRASIRRIEEVHPALGRHLQASVVTGTWCCYRPERATTWDTG